VSFEDFTVTSIEPFRVKRDIDANELPFEPLTLIDPSSLVEGDRVRGEWAGQRLIIHGRYFIDLS